MKKVFNFGRFIIRQPKRGGCVALIWIVLLLVAGCSKPNNPPPTPTPSSDATNAPTASTAVAAPITYAPATSVTNANDTQTQLQTLNKAMIGWMIKNHRHPQNFAEFASSTDVQIPAPPPGKKYTLNQRGFITLVDNSTQ